MLKNFTSKMKSLINGDSLFSSFSVLSFSKYKKHYSKTDFLNAYEISLYANRAIAKRAEKVGEIEFQLQKGDEVIEDHQILDLLKKPNKTFTGIQFWTLYQKYMDIFGEVYMIKDTESVMGGGTRVNELIILRSDLVKPFFDEHTGELLRIEYQTGKGALNVKGEEIVYIHNPSPASPLRGESLLVSGIRQIETSTQIDEYQNKVLSNGGRVEGVFNFKTPNLTKKQLDELKDNYQEGYADASKTGAPMFLSGDATFQRLGLDPAELAYLETKKVTLSDILILTGVPRAVLGMSSEETFANADASINIFLRETIRPLLNALALALDNNLEEEYELTAVDPTPKNKEELRKDAETGIKNYYLTPNEARELVGGLEPVENGDSILAPFSLMPLGEEPTEPTGEPDAEKIMTKQVKTPACKLGEETKADCVDRKIPELIEDGLTKDQALIVASNLCEKDCKNKRKVNHPLRNIDVRKVYHALCMKRLDTRQRKMANVIEEYFEGQMNRLIEQIQAQQQKGMTKGLLSEIFVPKLEIKLAKEAVMPTLQIFMQESAEDAKEIAGSHWEYQETAEIEGWLEKKTDVFADQINETTYEKLKGTFMESFSEGESRDQLVTRIQDTYKGISTARAEMIARTEVHGVTQYGTMQGYKQASMPIKIWVWAPGTKGGVRDNHLAMDGEEVPIDTAFSNGLKYPGDNMGSAGEVINCQCFI